MNNCYTTCLSKSMQEHPGLQVPLRSATGSNRFQIGEVIRLEVILSSNTPNRYLEPCALFRESNFGCTATLLGHRPPRPSRPSPWPPATRTAQWPRLPTRSNSLTTSELAIAGPGTTPRPSAVLGLSGIAAMGNKEIPAELRNVSLTQITYKWGWARGDFDDPLPALSAIRELHFCAFDRVPSGAQNGAQ